MGNTIGGGHDGRSDEPVRRALGRDASQGSGCDRVEAMANAEIARGRRLPVRPWQSEETVFDPDGHGLFPPGPDQWDIWNVIQDGSAELLPAHSRHDQFRIALGNARALAARDPAARPWLDPLGPCGLRAAVVQEIAQSTLRGVADGVAAARIDWLRLLGNGVVPLEAGYAVRTLVARLAARGSAAAGRLVRMTGTAP